MLYTTVPFDRNYLKVGGIILLEDGEEFEFYIERTSSKCGAELVLYSPVSGFIIKNIRECARLRMKIPVEIIPFSVEGYRTGEYDVVTRDGKKAKEVLISTTLLEAKQRCVIVFFDFEWYLVGRDGRKCGPEIENDSNCDVFLAKKDR